MKKIKKEVSDLVSENTSATSIEFRSSFETSSATPIEFRSSIETSSATSIEFGSSIQTSLATPIESRSSIETSFAKPSTSIDYDQVFHDMFSEFAFEEMKGLENI